MIAILISGAVRNLSETWPENKKRLDLLNQPYEVFVHSWTKNFGTPRKVYKDLNSRSFLFNFREMRYEEEEIHVSHDYIKSIIPNAHIHLDVFEENRLISEFNLSKYTGHHLFRNLVNSVAMYQGISRVFTHALHFKGKTFSNYVRLRTDFLITSDFPSDSLSSDIYFGGPGVEPGFGYVSDQFLVAGPLVAEQLAAFEERLKMYVTQNGWDLDTDRPFYGERVLSKFLYDIRNSIKILEGPVIGQIKRPAIAFAEKSFSFDYIVEMFQYNFKILSKKLFYKFAQFMKFLLRF